MRSKRKKKVFLKTILARRERAKRNEEIRKLPAVAQFALNEEQTLKRYVLCESKLPTNVVRSKVDSGSRSEIIVS